MVIAVRLRQHWAGASPHAPLPALQLDISGPVATIERLLQRRRQLKLILDQTKDLRRFEALLEGPLPGGTAAPEQWFQQWVAQLFPRRGIVPILPPTALAHRHQPSDGQPEQWNCTLTCTCAAEEIGPIRDLLRWSVDCWSWCLRERPPLVEALALASRLPAKRASALKPSFAAMARALVQQGVPLLLDSSDRMSLLWVGLGQNARRLSQRLTDQTSAWGLEQAKSKLLTKRRLVAAGLPVAAGALTHDLERAVHLASELGYPVVTKPAQGDQGEGVVTAIADESALRRAWPISAAHGSGVLIERHIEGRDFRFLLVHGRLLAALERIPGGVIGDGRHSVAALLKVENKRRSQNRVVVEGGDTISLVSLELDAEAEAMLANQGLTPQSVPAAGRRVRLRYSANFSMGGSVRECRAEMAVANVLLLETVARFFQLDLVGLDVIAPSISEPLSTNGGVICEVNGMPGVLPHMLAEPQRPLMAETAAQLLPTCCTVPLVAVHGAGAEALMAAIEAAVVPHQPSLLVLDRRGIRRGGEQLLAAEACSLALQTPWVRDPAAAALLLQLDGRDLAAHGVVWHRPDLLILLEPGEDPLPPPLRKWLSDAARRVIELDGGEAVLPPVSQETISRAVPQTVSHGTAQGISQAVASQQSAAQPSVAPASAEQACRLAVQLLLGTLGDPETGSALGPSR